MFEGQFYIRLILNVIVGVMFAYALYRMAKHNNQETMPLSHKAMHVFGWIFVGLSVVCLFSCIYYLTIVDFPQQLVGPLIGPNTIIRSTSAVFYWGYPTLIQNSTLTMALATFDFLGIGAYFLYFKNSNSKWWRKVLKFFAVLLLYAFMASATNFHYFDFPEFVAPVWFVIIWLVIVNRKDCLIKTTDDNIIKETVLCTETKDNNTKQLDTLYCNEDVSPTSLRIDNVIISQEDALNPNSIHSIELNSHTNPYEVQFCRHCGRKIEKDSIFCKYCGGRLDNDAKRVSSSRIVRVTNVFFAYCSKLVQTIHLRRLINNIHQKNKFMHVLRVICKTFIILILVTGIVFGIWYYIDEIRPERKAEQILISEQEILDNLNGDNLYIKCKDIIMAHSIPECGKDWRDRENLCELSSLAWQKIEKLAYNGNSEAQFMLGVRYGGYDFLAEEWDIYKFKDGMYRNPNLDYSKAAYWYLMAAEQNHSGAQNNLGNCYKYGNGVEESMEKAIYWFKQSATNGDDYGQLHYGDCFRDGYSIKDGTVWKKDPDCYWCNYTHKCTEHTYPMYKTILEANTDSAKYYWQKSANQGNLQAKERLQKIY